MCEQASVPWAEPSTCRRSLLVRALSLSHSLFVPVVPQTVPKSPMLLCRLRSDGRQRLLKSTEELELEQIELEKKQAKQRKRVRGDFDGMRNTRAKMGGAGVGSTTDPKRIGSGGFTVGAASNAASAPQRRSLRTTRKTQTTAEWKGVLTVPMSPAFATNGRVRAPRYKSTEELQLEEIARVRMAKKKGIGGGTAGGGKAGGGKGRPAPLTIPSTTGASRGAKSTTAARTGVSGGGSERTERSTKSAKGHPVPKTTQAMPTRSFGKFCGDASFGPITRSRATVVETKTRKPADAENQKDPEEKAAMSLAAAHDSTNATSARIRAGPLATSMLRLGGARRVAQTEVSEEAIDSNELGESDNAGSGAVEGRASPRDGLVRREPPVTRGQSILDRIAGGQKQSLSPPAIRPRKTFDDLARKDKHYNPLFEFKH